MQGIAMRPTRPKRHQNAKANIIPIMIEEKFITNVDTKEVAKLLT